MVLGLILVAILFGNTAYEAGNISGTILGVETLLGKFKFDLGYISFNFYSLAIGIIAASILWTGRYKIIQGFLILILENGGLNFQQFRQIFHLP